MTKGRVIGIVFLIVGLCLMTWGYDIYTSTGSKIGRAISGDVPMKAYALCAGGAFCAFIGIIKVK